MNARHVTQKLLVTVVVGGVVYLLTNVISSDDEGPWQLVLSVLCGGIVLIVQFLVSFVNQMHAVKDSVDKRFADIGRATKLFNEVEKLRDDGVPRSPRTPPSSSPRGPGSCTTSPTRRSTASPG